MKEYRLLIGLNDKDTKKQIIPTKKAMDIIINLVLKYFPYGATLSQNKGIYYNMEGLKTVENSISVMMVDCDDTINNDMISGFIVDCKTILNQESILLSIYDVNASFK